MPVSRYFGTPRLQLRLPVYLGHAERHAPHGAAQRSVCRGGEGAETVEMIKKRVQKSAKRLVRDCERFNLALAYLFCLPLPGYCLARFAYLLADLCTLT